MPLSASTETWSITEPFDRNNDVERADKKRPRELAVMSRFNDDANLRQAHIHIMPLLKRHHTHTHTHTKKCDRR